MLPSLSQSVRLEPISTDPQSGAQCARASTSSSSRSPLRRACACVVIGISAGFATTVSPPPAQAGSNVFHIFTPHVERGHWEAEILAGIQIGRPEEADHAEDHDDHDEDEEHGHGTPRSAYEISISNGVTDSWKAKLALGLTDDEDFTVSSLEFVNVFDLGAIGPGTHLGWFTAVEAGLDSGESNAFEFGPIMAMENGPFSLVLNPFLEKTFGKNREEGIALAYAWRAAYRLNDALAIGAEGYGEVENLGHAPGFDEQIHRIGPVLFLGHLHGAKHAEADHHGGHHGDHHGDNHGDDHVSKAEPEWHGEIGVLFGLSDATADTAIKLNAGVAF